MNYKGDLTDFSFADLLPALERDLHIIFCDIFLSRGKALILEGTLDFLFFLADNLDRVSYDS